MLVVRLLHQGNELARVEENTLQDPIVIGRGGECDWATPADDHTIGRKHATLLRKGRHLCLEAQETLNGTLLKGRKIASVRLKPGQRFQLGSCVLDVGLKGRQEVNARRAPPVLKVCSGRLAGKRIKLDKDALRIGADPESDLFLMDDLLVSRDHALLGTSGNGAFWVEDCQSRNGTCVNGEPLPAGKRRPLKNGDTIQIAHIEMRFMDGSSAQMMRRVGLSLLVIAATTLALWSGYKLKGWIVLRPADELFTVAKAAASREKFDQAEALLEKAKAARGYDGLKPDIEAVLAALPVWEKAAGKWSNVEGILRDESFWSACSSNDAAPGMLALIKDLNELSDMNYRAWEWQEGGGWRLGIVRRARGILLEVMLPLQTQLASEQAERERIDGLLRDGTNRLADVNEPMADDSTHTALLVHLVSTCRATLARGEELLHEWNVLDNTLLRLADGWPPPIREVSDGIDQRRQSPYAAIRLRADRYGPVLVQFNSFFDDLTERVKHVQALNYEEALHPISLPSMTEMSIATVCSALREKCANSANRLTEQVKRLKAHMDEIDRLFKDLGGPATMLNNWQDPARLERVRACSVLESAYPKASRAQPIGPYDEILGVEAFYAWLRDGHYGQLETSWTPHIFLLRKALDAVDSALNTLSKEEMKWLTAKGRAAEALRTLQTIARFRDEFVSTRMKEAQNGTGRAALISAGMALILQRDDGSAEGRARREFVKKLQTELHQELLADNDTYERASPEQKIKIRDEILLKGIPGHPVVKAMWIRRQN